MRLVVTLAWCAPLAFTGAITGCGSIMGLDGLHDRSDGGGTADARGDAGSTTTTGRDAKADGARDATTDGRAEAGSGAGSSTGSGSGSGSSTGSGSGSSSGSGSGSGTGSGPCPGLGSGSGSTPPSCAPGGQGMSNCGAASESCCTSLAVCGGTFDRTYTNSGAGAADAGSPATVSSFRLDKYLVTVGRFRQFVKAVMPGDAGPTGYTPAPGSGKHTHLNGGQGLASSAASGTYETGWVASDDSNVVPTDTNLECKDFTYSLWTWTTSAGAQEQLPINCVNWYEAYAFCIWDGGFLPSAAEWEYAAVGGAQEREYPWGSTDPGTGDQYAINGCNYPPPSGVCTSVAGIAPVGTAKQGAGLWGQLDLVGELWEWTPDGWDTGHAEPCVDCAYLPASTPYRMLWGSAFNGSKVNLSSPQFSEPRSPTDREVSQGFRCARAP